MNEEKFPVNPEALDRRLGEKEIQDMRDNLASRDKDELEMMLEYFNNPPAEEDVRSALQGSKWEKYPVEEVQRIFKLIQALIKTELEKHKEG